MAGNTSRQLRPAPQRPPRRQQTTGANGLRGGEKPGVAAIASPPLERNGLDFAEAERWFNGIDTDRQIGAALARVVGLVANKVPCRTD